MNAALSGSIWSAAPVSATRSDMRVLRMACWKSWTSGYLGGFWHNARTVLGRWMVLTPYGSRDRKKLNYGVRVRWVVKLIELVKLKLATLKNHFSKNQELAKLQLSFFPKLKVSRVRVSVVPIMLKLELKLIHLDCFSCFYSFHFLFTPNYSS